MPNHRLIAINLPQFHPFEENDKWWGKGFTEWTNVTKAKPRFKGHYQPHLPSDTGFYDLRLPESREMQADLAREAGIFGFCYYHYWFNGKQLMERPVNEIISSGKPDFPFMLCWANENWAKNWDGGFNDILIQQNYSDDDDDEHMRYLCENVFSDKRYIRIDNKPFFIIYKPYLFPDIQRTIKNWRTIAASYDIDLYLGFFRSDMYDRKEILSKGFDVAIDFQPHTMYHPMSKNNKLKWSFYKLKRKICKICSLNFKEDPDVWDYEEYMNLQLENVPSVIKEFPCITPSWDNSSRRVGKHFWALINNTPELYSKWLKEILNRFKPYSSEENFVFINAWNEWAEGNHIEPDQRWGKAYIDATRSIVNKNI